jgi:hypothetical protein
VVRDSSTSPAVMFQLVTFFSTELEVLTGVAPKVKPEEPTAMAEKVALAAAGARTSSVSPKLTDCVDPLTTVMDNFTAAFSAVVSPAVMTSPLGISMIGSVLLSSMTKPAYTFTYQSY